jgi:hypothetical protein
MSTLGGPICTFEEVRGYLHMSRGPLEANVAAWDNIDLFLEEKPSLLGFISV